MVLRSSGTRGGLLLPREKLNDSAVLNRRRFASKSFGLAPRQRVEGRRTLIDGADLLGVSDVTLVLLSGSGRHLVSSAAS